jgi:hypothetical protein
MRGGWEMHDIKWRTHLALCFMVLLVSHSLYAGHTKKQCGKWIVYISESKYEVPVAITDATNMDGGLTIRINNSGDLEGGLGGGKYSFMWASASEATVTIGDSIKKHYLGLGGSLGSERSKTADFIFDENLVKDCKAGSKLSIKIRRVRIGGDWYGGQHYEFSLIGFTCALDQLQRQRMKGSQE